LSLSHCRREQCSFIILVLADPCDSEQGRSSMNACEWERSCRAFSGNLRSKSDVLAPWHYGRGSVRWVTWLGLGLGLHFHTYSLHFVNNHFIHREKAAASKLPVSLSQSKHISQLPEMSEGQTHSEPVHLLHTTRCEHGP
jgi:hypothetical protein